MSLIYGIRSLEFCVLVSIYPYPQVRMNIESGLLPPVNFGKSDLLNLKIPLMKNPENLFVSPPAGGAKKKVDFEVYFLPLYY